MDEICKNCKWYHRVIVEPKSHYSTCPISYRYVDTDVGKCVDKEIRFCSCGEWEEIDVDLFDRLVGQPVDGSLRGVHIFCMQCGKEIFTDMGKDDLITINWLEESAICSDCLLKEIKHTGGDARDTN